MKGSLRDQIALKIKKKKGNILGSFFFFFGGSVGPAVIYYILFLFSDCVCYVTVVLKLFFLIDKLNIPKYR